MRYYHREVTFPFGRVVDPTSKDFKPTLAGVFEYLSKVTWELSEITIVSHGGSTGTMNFAVDAKDKDKRTTPDELRYFVKSGKLAKIAPGVITENTRIHLKACFVGNNQEVVELWDEALGGAGVVAAAKVKIGYNSMALTQEGLTGWWISSTELLKPGQIAYLLKEKYDVHVELDPMDKIDKQLGVVKMSEDEKWIALAEKAERKSQTVTIGGKPTTVHTYIAASIVQRHKDTDEYDKELYARSKFGDKQYMPDEI